MTGVLIHDGRRSGHHTWAKNAVSTGSANGVFISPFSTPRFRIPRYTSGTDFSQGVRDAGGEVIFDAMTHARSLAGSNRVDLYDTWELWGGPDMDLETALNQQRHVERVFDRQTELGTPHLVPTLALASPGSTEATRALEIAWIGRGIDDAAWQSVAGTRAFWRSGVALDAHIGSLVELRSPVWVVTLTNEMVLDTAPDIADVLAFEGLLRSVHSLSERSRVIIAFSDFAGLMSIAAGADTVGAGWDRAMRTFDPLSFHIDSDAGIRIPASYVTQRALLAVLRRDAAEAIERWNPIEARRIRGGAMPTGDPQERLHHLQSLQSEVQDLVAISDRALRVAALRLSYENAATDFDRLVGAVGPAVRASDKSTWITNQLSTLESYATAEGLW